MSTKDAAETYLRATRLYTREERWAQDPHEDRLTGMLAILSRLAGVGATSCLLYPIHSNLAYNEMLRIGEDAYAILWDQTLWSGISSCIAYEALSGEGVIRETELLVSGLLYALSLKFYEYPSLSGWLLSKAYDNGLEAWVKINQIRPEENERGLVLCKYLALSRMCAYVMHQREPIARRMFLDQMKEQYPSVTGCEQWDSHDVADVFGLIRIHRVLPYDMPKESIADELLRCVLLYNTVEQNLQDTALAWEKAVAEQCPSGRYTRQGTDAFQARLAARGNQVYAQVVSAATGMPELFMQDKVAQLEASLQRHRQVVERVISPDFIREGMASLQQVQSIEAARKLRDSRLPEGFSYMM